MRISDWSSDVCSSDLDELHDAVINAGLQQRARLAGVVEIVGERRCNGFRDNDITSKVDDGLDAMTMEYLFQHARVARVALIKRHLLRNQPTASPRKVVEDHPRPTAVSARPYGVAADVAGPRSEEHPSELQSLMRTAYASLRLT